MSLNAPWLIQKDTNTPTIKNFITTLMLNFHSRLLLATGDLFYNIRQTSLQLFFNHIKTYQTHNEQLTSSNVNVKPTEDLPILLFYFCMMSLSEVLHSAILPGYLLTGRYI